MHTRSNRLLALVRVAGTILEKLMRRRVKAMLYKRLYGGRWRWWDGLAVRLYKRLPGAHPLVKTTLEGR